MISRLILLTLLTLHPDILDDISKINNVYFDNIVSQIYASELQLNKANTCIFPFLIILFLLKFMINVTILI